MTPKPVFEELSSREADDLHAFVRRFRPDRRGSELDLGVYIDGFVPESPESARDEFARGVFESLRDLVSLGRFMHFADEEHTYARYYPHRARVARYEDFFFGGENISYVALDRSWGVAALTWLEPNPIWLFGEPLLSRLRKRIPALLSQLAPAP